MLKHLRHPNVIRLYSAYWTEDMAYLVMELCSGGELFSALEESGGPEWRAVCVCREIAAKCAACWIDQYAWSVLALLQAATGEEGGRAGVSDVRRYRLLPFPKGR